MVLSFYRPWRKDFYNIARVLALYKSYWAAMNKIFIYARPCVNKDFVHDDVFFVSFPKYPKIDGNEKKLSRLFFGIELRSSHSNQKQKRWKMFRK